jgi:hypothetical protein
MVGRILLAGALLAAAGLSNAAHSAETDLFTPPAGFWLAPKRRSGANENRIQLYGATDPQARWYISQWQSPNEDLPPFRRMTSSPGTTTWRTENSAASVELTRSPQGVRYELSQDGSRLPCSTAGGQPREFDLFAGANTRSVSEEAPSARLADADRRAPIRLDSLRSLVLTVNADVAVAAGTTADTGCQINRANVLAAVVLRNSVASPRQVFFYQLALFTFCRPGPTEAACRQGIGRSFFWWAGEEARNRQGKIVLRKFGYRDTLTNFGQPMLAPAEPSVIRLDLLPHLAALIRSGENGLDPDLSHWEIGSVYHGQNIWGAVRLQTTWSDFRLIAVTN